MPKTLPVSDIRNAFPALKRVINGNPVAYFDGPGGTQVPSSVPDAMVDYLLNHNANTHWEYAASRETDEIIAKARLKVATFLNADIQGVAFGANMTTLTFHLARALARTFDPGSWIVVTDLDHQANVGPWVYAAKENDLEVKTVSMTPDGQLNHDELDAYLTPDAALVAIGAASNALGTVNDLNQIIATAKKSGTLTFVDAVHYAPHYLVDFKSLGCDFLACSPYKFYGPHAGVIASKPKLLASLNVPKLEPSPDTVPERLETGTLSHEAITGTAAAIDFLAGCSEGDSYRDQLTTTFETLHQRGQSLLEQLWAGLESIPSVTLFGPSPELARTPTVGFTVEGIDSSKVASLLAERNAVFVSHGDFYASKVTESLGLGEEGLVRAGCACYTSEEEVQRLVEGVAEIATR